MGMPRSEISELIQKFSNNLVTSTSDLMLLAVYFDFPFQYDGGINGHEQGAFDAYHQIRPNTLKRAFVHLRQKGLLEADSSKTHRHKLTELGLKEIDRIVPRYYKERNWDGKLYIVTYDLPVEKNSDRNAFRAYLKSIRSGMLQHSVWVSVYNPKDQIREYLDNKGLSRELVIVSSVGDDGYIGNMDFKQVVNKVYGLDKLNERYRGFLHMVSEGVTKEWTVFVYLSILKDDPQVPFDLQPEDWAGYEAFEKYNQIAFPQS